MWRDIGRFHMKAPRYNANINRQKENKGNTILPEDAIYNIATLLKSITWTKCYPLKEKIVDVNQRTLFCMKEPLR